MITVGMNYQVVQGKEEAFEAVFRKVLETMESIDGHKHSALFRDVHETQKYLIISEWTKREAFDAFTASDEFKKVTNWGKQSILQGLPKHEVYTTADDASKNSAGGGGCPISH